jgi:hypothetical protein
MVACLLALGGQSFAELCTIDAVPAATLLLPVFKVDIGDDNGNGVADCADGVGIDTLFSINNASAAPALAHVVLWTDWSWPSLDFDVYLTGYDMQSVSLCQVIANGSLPVTADVQSDPDDEISPSPWGQDISVEGCANIFPFPDPVLTGGILDRVQTAHTGQVVPGLGPASDGACDPGDCCTGNDFGDDIARGYVTVDNAHRCSLLFPNQEGYFGPGGSGVVASNQNVLWGDYFKIDRANAFAQGDTLVHIEADESLEIANQGPNAATGYTFYGRYSSTGPFQGWDAREPLGTTWAARYLNGGPFNGGTKFSVWRDSTANLPGLDINRGWACGSCAAGSVVGPAWCPLNETQVVCFDEQEDCEELCFEFGGGVVSPPTLPTDPVCFPLESNHVQVGTGDLVPSWPFGWCYLNLNHSFGGFPGGAPWPPGGGPIAQSYVSVSHDALGLYSVGYSAIELTSACSDADPLIDTLNDPVDGPTDPPGVPLP